MSITQKQHFRHSLSQLSHPDTLSTSYGQSDSRIQCAYTNGTTQFQIVRIVSLSDSFLERAVMPYTSVIFEAYHDDHLEIHTGNPISSILSDKIPCYQLACQTAPGISPEMLKVQTFDA